MLCFSLGTVPLMLGFGSFFFALGKKFTRQILKIGAVLVVVMGLSMMVQGSALSGLGSRSAGKATADGMQNNDRTDTATEKDGVQYVSSTLKSGQYPDITVKAGEPVKWEIQAPEGSINGCNYKMLLQDFDMEYIFENGENLCDRKSCILSGKCRWHRDGSGCIKRCGWNNPYCIQYMPDLL